MAKKKTAKKAPEKGTEEKVADEKVVLEKMDVRTFDVILRGLSPLIVHKFSEKAKKQIEDKQAKKAVKGKEKREPKLEYLAACYVMPGSEAGKEGCVYAIKAAAFKCAAVGACRYIDMTMQFAKGAFFIEAEADGLIPLKFSGTHPRMHEDAVRIGQGGTLDLRYRPEFAEWSVAVKVRYNATAISAEQIINLLNYAGFHSGVGELRPEKGNGGGQNGLFEVAV